MNVQGNVLSKSFQFSWSIRNVAAATNGTPNISIFVVSFLHKKLVSSAHSNWSGDLGKIFFREAGLYLWDRYSNVSTVFVIPTKCVRVKQTTRALWRGRTKTARAVDLISRPNETKKKCFFDTKKTKKKKLYAFLF